MVILAMGRMVHEACLAAQQLEKLGVSASVVNARFIKPLDVDCITGLARQTPRILCVEENTLCGGFSSAVLEALCDAGVVHAHVRRLGIPDRFIEHGPTALLRKNLGLDASGIVKASVDFLHDLSKTPALTHAKKTA